MKQAKFFQDGQVISCISKKGTQDYKILKYMNEGCFGQIYKITSEKSNYTDTLAVKILPKMIFTNDKSYKERLQREKNILEQLDHENICRLISFAQDQTYYYLVQEYCDRGNLRELINKKSINKKIPLLSEKVALPYMKQIIKCFEYIHTRSEEMIIIHRDIKLENIFISSGGEGQDVDLVKVGDFGFAKEKPQLQLVKTLLGSPFTMAPEIITIGEYDERADIYSLGVMFYEILFGESPFQLQDNFVHLVVKKPVEVQQRLVTEELAQLAKIKTIDMNLNGMEISKDMQDLLRKMITFNPKDRIIFRKLFKHRLFRDKKLTDSQLCRQSQASVRPLFILVISDQIQLAQQFIQEYIDEVEYWDNLDRTQKQCKQICFNEKYYEMNFMSHEVQKLESLTDNAIRQQNAFFLIIDLDRSDLEDSILVDTLIKWNTFVCDRTQGSNNILKVVIAIKDKTFEKQQNLLLTLLNTICDEYNICSVQLANLQDDQEIQNTLNELIEKNIKRFAYIPNSSYTLTHSTISTVKSVKFKESMGNKKKCC